MCFQKECEVDESVPNLAVLRRVVASASSLFRSRWVTRSLFCLKASRFSTDGFFLSLLRGECLSFLAVSMSLFTKGFFFIVLIIFEGMNFDAVERNVSFHADRAQIRVVNDIPICIGIEWTESVNSAPFKRGETKVQIFGKEKCKTHRQFQRY